MRIVDTTMCAAQWIVFVFDEAIISLAVNSINFIIVICRALIQDSQAKISILCTDFMFYGDGNSKYLFSLDVCVCALYEGWHLKMNRRNHVHAHSNNTQHTVNCWFLLQWCDLSLNETNVTVNEEINLWGSSRTGPAFVTICWILHFPVQTSCASINECVWKGLYMFKYSGEIFLFIQWNYCLGSKTFCVRYRYSSHECRLINSERSIKTYAERLKCLWHCVRRIFFNIWVSK